jgi:plasmid stabilization system protein ParE
LIGIQKAINALQTLPHAYPLAREASILPFEVRQLVYKSHRVIFSIEKDIVRIHRVVHTARKNMTTLD